MSDKLDVINRFTALISDPNYNVSRDSETFLNLAYEYKALLDKDLKVSTPKNDTKVASIVDLDNTWDF